MTRQTKIPEHKWMDKLENDDHPDVFRNDTTKAGERTQHTPGPWTLRHDRFADHQDKTNAQVEAPHAGNFAIALVYSGQKGPQNIANARLIAAAPDLLADINEAHSLIHKGEFARAGRILSSAIAKAKGSNAAEE